MTVPAFGLGTFRLKGQVVIDSVKNALELGYRAVDTAQIYENEADVGQAIAESGVARDQLYITSKIWISHFSKDALIPSLKDSLKKLRTEHLDLTLIHWPSPNNAVPVAEFMGALLEAKQQGLTRAIGVSNFTIALMKEAIAAVGAENIATNQIELHPYLQNRKVAEFAKSQGIIRIAHKRQQADHHANVVFRGMAGERQRIILIQIAIHIRNREINLENCCFERHGSLLFERL